MTEQWRRLDVSVELEATPEQVWETVSTAAGMSAWFVPHETGDEGEMSGDFGAGATQAGRILAWDEGKRVVYGPPDATSEEDTTFALEFLVEGRDNATTVLRLVQSQFAGDNWEDEFEGHRKGWEMYFHNLASYFRYFAGQPVTPIIAAATVEVAAGEAMGRIRRALGVADGVAVGDSVRATADGVGSIVGTVDLAVDDAVLGVRTDDALYRFMAHDARSMAFAHHYFYGEGVDRAARATAWQGWIGQVFPA